MTDGCSDNDSERSRQDLKLVAVGGNDADVALARLYDRYSNDVLRGISRVVLISRHGNAIQLELAQEVWLTVWRKAHQINPKTPPKAWILLIAKNISRNYLRVKKNRVLDSDDFERHQTYSLDSMLAVHDSLVERCINQAFNQIKKCCPTCEDLLKANIIDGLTGEELATMLNISRGAARQKLYECRKCLRELLENCSGFDSESQRV